MKPYKIIGLSIALISLLALSGYSTYRSVPSPNGWPSSGQNKGNTSFQSREHLLSPSNVSNLQVKWIYNTDDNSVMVNKVYPKSSVIATPSVDKKNQIVYFGDLNGRLHAVYTATGKPLFIKSIVYDYLQDYVAQAGVDITKVNAMARSTPVIYNNTLLLTIRPGMPDGTMSGMPNLESMLVTRQAIIVAVDRFTGALLWKTRAAPSNPVGSVTGSLSVFGGKIYGGVSDFIEEAAPPSAFDGGNATSIIGKTFLASGIPLPAGGYKCCGANGSIFALSANNGKLLWSVPTIDPSVPHGFGGWNGASAWGSNPSIDPSLQSVFVATGNTFNTPTDPATVACLTAAGSNIAARNACMPAGARQESILALNLNTGAIRWSKTFHPLDVGGFSCIGAAFYGLPNTGCNDPLISDPGGFGAQTVDADFGQMPMLTEVNGVQTLLIGQKSGFVFSLNPSNGNLNWQTQDTNGSFYGGHEWGMATDGIRVYGQATNANLIPVTLVNEFTPTPTGPGGYFSTLDAKTGAILWQTRDPNALTINPAYMIHATIYGTVSTANGVVYGSSVNHTLFALNAANGKILWQDNTNVTGSGFAAPAIVQGTLYWPTGFAPVTFAGSPTNPVDANDPFTPYDNKVIAYTVPTCSGDLDNSSADEDDNIDLNGN